MKENYIFAAKDPQGDYYAERIVSDLQRELYNLEYGDVAEGEYQIWEYPSGKIYQIVPDREVTPNDYYSVPCTSKGVVWELKLTHIHADVNLVKKEYERLSGVPEGGYE